MNPETATRQEVEGCIKAWREARTQRLELDRKAAVAKKSEDSYKSFLIEAFRQQKLEGMLIDGRVSGLATKEIPVVEDKEAFMSYIRETGSLELLQFRLSAPAVAEREEAGVEVPGIGKMETYELFDRKA